MLIPNHPDDERLSALASDDADATADASLTGHVSTCERCTDLVNELGALRASLAELPDLQPSRPLRLLPGVADEPAPADRLGAWARRFFAPVLTAGAALAMVGLVGTAAPGLSGMASGPGGDAAVMDQEESEAAGDAGGEAAPAAEPSRAARALDGLAGASAEPDYSGAERDPSALEDTDGDEDRLGQAPPIPAERSPWPMVLFTGVAVMIAAALLRWILVPRAG